MTALSINLNKVSLLRNSREGNYPDILSHARLCIDNGADGITVHPRPDQRHIRPSDVRILGALITSLAGIEFNIEGNPFAPAVDDYPGFLPLVTEIQPDQCTLVPDGNDQLTSDHGFDLFQSGERLAPIIAELKSQGMRVSLFMDPDAEQIKQAALIGADRIELYTGPFAAAWGTETADDLFNQHKQAALLATSLGMGVNAGHDLNLHNLAKFATIPNLLEVSIGHAFIVDSLTMGMASAVQTYKKHLNQYQ
ncbi:MAG: pyridoxine 5'-phosphate synthase [Porticoccaceae bacterium]|nr:pyridoxine 5'-phosphate synthase [Porticoccaceae bacterium]MDG1474729.1 pyridoxine 5'-phosphate synthase [Porticoccaceae bacterium]